MGWNASTLDHLMEPYALGRNGLSAEEIASRGRAVYEERLRSDLEREHMGDHVVIDVKSGDYAAAHDDLDATLELMARRPDAVTFGIRIGHDSSYRLGVHLASPTR